MRKNYSGYPMSGGVTLDKRADRHDKTKDKSKVIVAVKKVGANENNHSWKTDYKEE